MSQGTLGSLGLEHGKILYDEMRWYCTMCEEYGYGLPPYFEDRYHYCLKCRRINHLVIVFEQA